MPITPDTRSLPKTRQQRNENQHYRVSEPELRQQASWTLDTYDGEPIPVIPTTLENFDDLLVPINAGIRRLQNNLVELRQCREAIHQRKMLQNYQPDADVRVQ